MWLYHRVMRPNDADGMANSVDPDQTAPLGAVRSGSALFAQAYLSENLGSLRYQGSYGHHSNHLGSICSFLVVLNKHREAKRNATLVFFNVTRKRLKYCVQKKSILRNDVFSSYPANKKMAKCENLCISSHCFLLPLVSKATNLLRAFVRG